MQVAGKRCLPTSAVNCTDAPMFRWLPSIPVTKPEPAGPTGLSSGLTYRCGNPYLFDNHLKETDVRCGVSGSDFTISGVSNAIGSKIQTEKDQLGQMMADYDPDDPMAAVKLEMEVAKYKAEVSLVSALVKDLSDVQQQVIQKV